MNKRDLKADLEFCDRAIQDAIERALKAEALARELVEALEKAIEEVNHPICGPGSVVGDLEEVLDKAKEVLGDDKVHAG